jgi:hypothetical protein
MISIKLPKFAIDYIEMLIREVSVEKVRKHERVLM